MFDIFDTKHFNHKEYAQKFSKEQVTEELDNIPSDRYIHTVNPLMAKQILSQAQYDYKPREYEEGGEDCTSSILEMDITEREEYKRKAMREADYESKKIERQKGEEEDKEYKTKLRKRTKKILDEE